MIENLKKLNPEISFFHISDKEFETFGRVIENLDCSEILQEAKKIPFPREGSSYLPSVENFESLRISEKIKDAFFGTLPAQTGYCFGQNTLMNATEWHFSNEINIATTPLVLLLAKKSDIVDNKISSSKFKAFYLPEGTVIEVYATTLHFCPCQVSDDGFGCVVALPEGTNIPLENKTEDPVLFRKNKWLLCHEENKALVEKGVVPGISGINFEIKYQ